MRVLASSSVYETEPVGEVLDQREFLNACLRIETDLEPEALLDACKAVERELGRVAGERLRAPRPAADRRRPAAARRREHVSERLTLPHREVTSRRFVLVPLLELAPELECRAAAARPTRSPRSVRARTCGWPGRR